MGVRVRKHACNVTMCVCLVGFLGTGSLPAVLHCYNAGAPSTELLV